ncbi:MAG: transcription initiation factor IIB [Candidatus Lokiarchaeota archaeon]|nr:transcription initiation factor IIB [Candidatus Lokiarchaeota archaeon]
MGTGYEKCPCCGSDKAINDTATGDLLCSNCGTVFYQHMIDHGAEWRAFDSTEREKKSRVGAPLTLTMHDKGLSTNIDYRDIDAHGKVLSPSARERAKKNRKWHSHMRANSSMDRNLTRALYELERICSQLNLCRSVKDRAAFIYRNAIKNNLIRGRSIESMIAACIYTACRFRSVPILYEDIIAVSPVKKKDLHRCYCLIYEQLQKDYFENADNEECNPFLREKSIPQNSPKNFLSRFCTELGLSAQTEIYARQILDFASKLRILGGKDPSGLAAAALYIAAIKNDEKRTQHDVANVAKITEVTVRNRYKDLVALLTPRGLKIDI